MANLSPGTNRAYSLTDIIRAINDKANNALSPEPSSTEVSSQLANVIDTGHVGDSKSTTLGTVGTWGAASGTWGSDQWS